MLPEIEDKIWEDILKGKIKPKTNDFLILIFLFIVQKSFNFKQISLLEGKQALRNFFLKHIATYDFEKIFNT